MATQAQNAVAILNAAYNSVFPGVATMPVPLRDRFITAYRKLTPDGENATTEQIAAVMNQQLFNALRSQLKFSETQDLASANSAQIDADTNPTP